MSASEFEDQKFFIIDLMKRINISQDGIKVAVVTFGDNGYMVFSLDRYNTSAEIQIAIQNIARANSAYGRSYRYADRAVEYASENVFSKNNGDRMDALDYFVILTHGYDYGDVENYVPVLTSDPNNEVFILVIDYSSTTTYRSAVDSDHFFYWPSFTSLTCNNQNFLSNFTYCPTSTPTSVNITTPDCKLDVVFIIETSSSSRDENFLHLKYFYANLASQIHVSRDTVRIAAITYNSDETTVFNLSTYSTSAEVAYAIKQIPDEDTISGNYIDNALTYAQTDIFTTTNGDRADADNFYVFSVDGSRSGTATQGQQIRQNPTNHIFALDIGSGYSTEWKNTVGDEEKYFYVSSYATLSSIESDVLTAITTCQLTTTTTQTTTTTTTNVFTTTPESTTSTGTTSTTTHQATSPTESTTTTISQTSTPTESITTTSSQASTSTMSTTTKTSQASTSTEPTTTTLTSTPSAGSSSASTTLTSAQVTTSTETTITATFQTTSTTQPTTATTHQVSTESSQATPTTQSKTTTTSEVPQTTISTKTETQGATVTEIKTTSPGTTSSEPTLTPQFTLSTELTTLTTTQAKTTGIATEKTSQAPSITEPKILTTFQAITSGSMPISISTTSTLLDTTTQSTSGATTTTTKTTTTTAAQTTTKPPQTKCGGKSMSYTDFNSLKSGEDKDIDKMYLFTDTFFILTCCGRISEWEVHHSVSGYLDLIVWRSTATGKYRIVGYNSILVDGANTTTFSVLENERIAVVTGDLIGWRCLSENVVTYGNCVGSPGCPTMTRKAVGLGNLAAGSEFDWDKESTVLSGVAYAVKFTLEDNIPIKFPSQNISVRDHIEPGGYVADLRLEGVDYMEDVTYQLLPDATDPNQAWTYFTVNSKGRLRTTRRLIQSRNLNMYHMTVNAEDSCDNKATILLEIATQNWPPFIHSLPNSISIEEDTAQNKIIYTTNVTDAYGDPVCCTLSNTHPQTFNFNVTNDPPGSSVYHVTTTSIAKFVYEDFNSYLVYMCCDDTEDRAQGILTVNIKKPVKQTVYKPPQWFFTSIIAALVPITIIFCSACGLLCHTMFAT